MVRRRTRARSAALVYDPCEIKRASFGTRWADPSPLQYRAGLSSERLAVWVRKGARGMVDVVLAVRGTKPTSVRDLAHDATIMLDLACVHTYRKTFWPEVKKAVETLMKEFPQCRLVDPHALESRHRSRLTLILSSRLRLSGHSLGGDVALQLGILLAETLKQLKDRLSVYLFNQVSPQHTEACQQKLSHTRS